MNLFFTHTAASVQTESKWTFALTTSHKRRSNKQSGPCLRIRSHPWAFDKKRGRDAGGFDPQRGKFETEQAASNKKERMCTSCTTLKLYKLHHMISGWSILDP
jgi:hypothetical protein